MHLPFNIFNGSFPTPPDFNEILMDGTVFYADSNGMSVFSRNEKVTALHKVIFPIYLWRNLNFVFADGSEVVG